MKFGLHAGDRKLNTPYGDAQTLTLLVFDVCMKRVLRWFSTSARERTYMEECATREPMSNVEFYQHYYADSEVSLETCTLVRTVLRDQLAMRNTRPHDNVAAIFDDVDIGEICMEIGEELGVTFSDTLIDAVDGSVDSLVRATHEVTRTD